MSQLTEIDIDPRILHGLKDLGFNSFFPIQEKAIPPLMAGRDVIGQSHTGSGKTAAFGIPLISKVDPNNTEIQGLVLAPTRELAVQITKDLNTYAKYTDIRALAVYGGESIERQFSMLRENPRIIVATPGRLLDHLERRSIRLDDVSFIVLDEADRMLDMGFIEDIERILRNVPEGRQVALFSATMPREIQQLAERYMHSPEKILLSKDEIGLEQIDQLYLLVEEKFKFDALSKIFAKQAVKQAIVFCATKWKTGVLATELQKAGYQAMPIHGDLTQRQRDTTMMMFRKGKADILVATDVASRGLDITGVSHVINFEVPPDTLSYFHRIGRTARAGREGVAITLVSPREYEDLVRIQNMTKIPIRKMQGFIEYDMQPKVLGREYRARNRGGGGQRQGYSRYGYRSGYSRPHSRRQW
ncbi:MAG: DEAD/DEAH box helicase [Thaumarchaeota archaeon]|nr:DEAD/DEAH box helicase [Nitrososphaerota archaeon]